MEAISCRCALRLWFERQRGGNLLETRDAISPRFTGTTMNLTSSPSSGGFFLSLPESPTVWTKTSVPVVWSRMNPKPLLTLNHLTWPWWYSGGKAVCCSLDNVRAMITLPRLVSPATYIRERKCLSHELPGVRILALPRSYTVSLRFLGFC